VARARLAVVHVVSGRLRLRLPARASTRGLAEAIRALPGVTDAVWNPRTDGLLVRYRANETAPGPIMEAVARHAGVAAAGAGEAEIRDEPLAVAVTSAVSDLNARVASATRGRLDLGVLVPFALTAWAITEVVRRRVDPLGWSSALWYAHGLFRDYALRDRS